MSIAKIRIKTDVIGIRTTIEIDGVDVSKAVQRVVLEARASTDTPTVYLELIGADVEVDGEAVPLIGTEPEPPAHELLAEVDPQALESRALEIMSDGGLGGTATGEAFLAAIREALGGDDDRS